MDQFFALNNTKLLIYIRASLTFKIIKTDELNHIRTFLLHMQNKFLKNTKQILQIQKDF